MQQAIILKLVEEVRVEMPRVGGRKLYHIIKDPLSEHGINIGRDKLFDALANFGLLIKKKKRRKPITTDSDHPFFKYPNLIKDLEIFYPNQVWVSGISIPVKINPFHFSVNIPLDGAVLLGIGNNISDGIVGVIYFYFLEQTFHSFSADSPAFCYKSALCFACP